MQAFNAIYSLIDIKVKNNRRFWSETLSTYLWTTVLIVDLTLVVYLTVGNFNCIRVSTNEGSLTNVTFLLDLDSSSTAVQYLQITCATEIKYKALTYYFLRIFYIVFGCIYMISNKFFVSKINRYESIITDQIKLREYVGFKKVNPNIEYSEKLRIYAHRFFIFKIVLLTLYSIFYVLLTLFQYGYEPFREFIVPYAKTCGGPGVKLHFNRERMAYRCHFVYEWSVFIGTVFSDFIKILVLVVFIVSAVHLARYIKHGITEIKRKSRKIDLVKTVGTPVFEGE